MTWTHFWDMHSGGDQKEPQAHIYIEAPEDEAVIIFYNRFGHSPHRVSCTCCGSDYAIDAYESLEQATGYQRGCEYHDDDYIEEPRTSFGYTYEYQTLEQYRTDPDVLIIPADQIKDEERTGYVPRQGYVWQD